MMYKDPQLTNRIEEAQYVRLTGDGVTPLPPESFSLINSQSQDYHSASVNSAEDKRVFTTTCAFPQQWFENDSQIFFEKNSPPEKTELNSVAQNYYVPALKRHVGRVMRQSAAMGLVDPRTTYFSENSLHDAALHLLGSLYKKIVTHSVAQTFAIPDLRLRIILDKTGAELFADTLYHPWNKVGEIATITFDGIRDLPQVKLASAKVSRAAREAAEARGAHEALLCNRQGYITEGAWTNLFWFDLSGKLFQPAEPLLPGIIREAVESCRTVELRSVTAEYLLNEAAEVFVTQSTKPMTKINSINGTMLGHSAEKKNKTNFCNELLSDLRKQLW